MLEFDHWADGLADAAVVVRANAIRAGLDAPVPTCPGWTVRDLIAHLGTVHRWATARLRNADIDPAAVEDEGKRHVDPLEWLAEGCDVLLRTLDHAEDSQIPQFWLADPPTPRIGWVRRQCHETTIHAVDAMAAALRRPPTAEEVWFSPALAGDGVDEMLAGFLPRERTSFRFPEPGRALVHATDIDRTWLLAGTAEGTTTTRDPDPGEIQTGVAIDTTLAGTAVNLYLCLWNRSGPLTESTIAESGRPLLAAWHKEMKVKWR